MHSSSFCKPRFSYPDSDSTFATATTTFSVDNVVIAVIAIIVAQRFWRFAPARLRRTFFFFHFFALFYFFDLYFFFYLVFEVEAGAYRNQVIQGGRV